LKSQFSRFLQVRQELRPNLSNSLQIFDVGDAHNGWLKAAPRCKSLPIAGRDFTSERQPTNEDELQVRSMRGFKEPGFTDRQKAAQQAKQKLLDKFRSQPGADDPEVLKRRAERAAVAANREQARLAREAEKAEQKRREEEAAAAEAARIAREKEEEEARLAAAEAEQKARRDARYAARKERGKKKR
jgi:hypothetical protein